MKAGRVICRRRPGNGGAADALLYAGANRLTSMRLAVLDLPEGNAMRAPGEAPGLMALEIAMDEMAEKLGMDPIQFRIVNDTQVDPEKPSGRSRSASCRMPALGAERFGWTSAARPRQRCATGAGWSAWASPRASATTCHEVGRAGPARCATASVTVETDMTDIGTGSYTIIAQTAAEMMGLCRSTRSWSKLGDSSFPVSPVRAANGAQQLDRGRLCRLRQAARGRGAKLGFNSATPCSPTARCGRATAASRSPGGAARATRRRGRDRVRRSRQDATSNRPSAAISSRSAVDAYTGEIRVRRMLAVCAAGRILNPKSARSQVIGAMTMGAGAALMEELAVDKRFGFFVNHDLAGYEVPVHADIPHQEVIFLDEPTRCPRR
jgi:xanthine dehydrogenase YagR molybdenum-binding subunit